MASSWGLGDLLNVFAKLETAVNKFYERTDLIEDNKERLRRLQRKNNKISEIKRKLDDGPRLDVATTSRLEIFKEDLEADAELLNKYENDIDDATVYGRVRRAGRILDGCEIHVTQFLEFLTSEISPKLEREEEGLPQDSFCRASNVPLNPPRLALDYETTTTCEGQLKAAILDEEENRRIAAVVAFGAGGMGKTCAARGLASLSDVKDRFFGGILYIQLGNEASIPDIIQGVAAIVKRTGGKRLAREVARFEKLEQVCETVAAWFAPHNCLFIIDDIWWGNGIDYNVFTVLATMVNSKSRLLYTTRCERFLDGSDHVICFKEREPHGSISKRMLMSHAGFGCEEELKDENEEAFRGILDVCIGLPLAFGVAGRTVSKYSRRRENSKQRAWTDFYRDISSRKFNIAGGSAVQFGSVQLIVERSLNALEDEKNYGKSFEEMFWALCVVQKQQKVPISMLQALWDLEGVDQTEAVAEQFDSVCIVSMRRDDDDDSMYVQAHDIILEIAMLQASEQCKVKDFFKTLVSNYRLQIRMKYDKMEAEANMNVKRKMSLKRILVSLRNWRRMGCVCPRDMKESVAEDQSETEDIEAEEHNGSRAWWTIEDDGYIYNNLCRILKEAEYFEELLWVLSRPHWIVKRLQTGRIYGVEEDVGYGKEVVRKSGKDDKSYVIHLRVMGQAARMSNTFVERNPCEAWSQMYGRLLWYAEKCKKTRDFVEEIERCAPRPWAKPSVGFLQPTGGALDDILEVPEHVKCLTVDEDDVLLLYGDGVQRKIGMIHYNVTTGTRSETFDFCGDECSFKTVGLSPLFCATFSPDKKVVVMGHTFGEVTVWDIEAGRILRTHRGDALPVISVAVNVDATRIVSGSMNDKFRVWDALSAEENGVPLVIETECLTCVAINADGTRIASGSSDGTIRLWDAHSGKAVGEPHAAHTGSVNCLAFSAGGMGVVSGSSDGTARIWDMRSAELVGEPLEGHTSDVECVAVSEDGRRIVSGSRDRTVRVWDTQSGRAVGKALVGHTSTVLWVAMSNDGTLIVSGSADGSVRVWRARSIEVADGPLVGHAEVQCMLASADGSRIVSGSSDGTVRVWDIQSGKVVGEPHATHTGEVVCLAFSADEMRVVSGSSDGTIRIWGTRSGETVGEPLEGHSSIVECVAVSEDGSRIVSGSWDCTVRVWDARSGMAVGEPLAGHTGTVKCVAVSADGSRIVSGSWDHTIRVWDARTMEAVGEPVVGHQNTVQCVALSGDETRIVSGAWDDSVRVWDARSREAVGKPFEHSSPLHVGIDVTGSRVASFSRYGDGKLWDVSGGECIATSMDAKWESTLRALSLNWSGREQPRNRRSSRVTCSSEDGGEIVLLTMETCGLVYDDVWFTPTLSGSCRVVV